jgi:pilus assembly protein Flp/PilA
MAPAGAGCMANSLSVRTGLIMKNLIARFIREDEGQDLIEYAFLAVFIALVVTAGLTLVGTAVNDKMSTIASSVSSGS